MTAKELAALAKSKGDRLAIVPVERMENLKSDLIGFQAENELNGFTNWIFDKLYRFQMIPEKMRSIVIVAVPRPGYAKIYFNAINKPPILRNLYSEHMYCPITAIIGKTLEKA